MAAPAKTTAAYPNKRLAAEHRDDLGDDAHGREDEDVDLGVAEEPEEVLPEDRVTAGGGIEEERPELAVERDHEQGDGDDRQREQQQERHHQGHPDEDRHPQEAHALGSQVEEGDDEVDRRDQRGDAEDLKAEDGEVERRDRGRSWARRWADT